MPKVSIQPDNWAGVTEEDLLSLDEQGRMELQNEYEMIYLGAQIRTDADPLQEVKRRCALALRVHWDLRKVWAESRLEILDKMRLYRAARCVLQSYR